MPRATLNGTDNLNEAMAVPAPINSNGSPIFPKRCVFNVSGVSAVSGYSNVYTATDVKLIGQIQSGKWVQDGLTYNLTGKKTVIPAASCTGEIEDVVCNQGGASTYYDFVYANYRTTPDLDDLLGTLLLKDGELYKMQSDGSGFDKINMIVPEDTEPVGYILEAWSDDRLNAGYSWTAIKVCDDKGVAYMLSRSDGYFDYTAMPYAYGVMAFDTDGNVKTAAEATILLHDGKYYNFLGFTGDTKLNSPDDISDRNDRVDLRGAKFLKIGNKWKMSKPLGNKRLDW